MKKILTLAICMLLVLNLAGCKITIELRNGGGKMEIALSDSQSETSAPDTSLPDTQNETSDPETSSPDTQNETSDPDAASPDTQSEPTAPAETFPMPTGAVNVNTVLADAMYEKWKIRTEQGAVMYVSEHVVACQGTGVIDWRYLDFNQDGQNEVFVETDSMNATYMILHWNGTEIRCYDFGHRHIQELKENGYMSGSNGASSTIYYRISFSNNEMIQHTLALFDTAAKQFLIDESTVTEAEANAFLREWYQIPNVIGISYYPPEETQKVTCAVCGRGVDQNFNWEAGLCEECSWYYGRCTRCGRISADLYEGICEVCEPYGGMGAPGVPGFCLLCCQSHYSTIGGACDNCRQPGGQCCNQCGRWANEPADGYCPGCKARADGVVD